jgi:site-specific recombinase XerD
MRHSVRPAWHSVRVINELFTFSSTIERLRQGPLSEHLDTYAATVAEQGYTHDSIRQQIVIIADFSRWLKQKDIDVQVLNGNVVDRFLRLRRRQQRIRRGEPKTLARLLAMLCQKGVVKHQKPVTVNARTRITDEFRCYLLQERGLSPSTLLNYVPVAEQFLTERFHNTVPNFAMIRATHVTGFVLRHARQLSPVRAGLMVTALRSFFRYLRHRGLIATDLAACVPTVPNWSLSTLPRFLPATTVERILKCCDRSTADGRRNHAILLLLARLGVRAGEVVGLRLDDIDWSAGCITIRGKGGKSAQLPLANEVGTAIASYLRHDRPRSATRNVFLRHRAPLVGFGNSSTVSSLVRRALKHAGIESAHTGAHVLRHSLATSLLRQGGSLDEIGELLRHQSPNTTAIYAKVDVTALHTLALPWPGGSR